VTDTLAAGGRARPGPAVDRHHHGRGAAGTAYCRAAPAGADRATRTLNPRRRGARAEPAAEHLRHPGQLGGASAT
jgi:hypothetical protein